MSAPLTVTTWGNGDALTVALHGWGGSHATFLPLVPHIPPSEQIIAPDLPGYGESKLPDRWDTSRVAEMVAESVPADRQFMLLGNCTGGVIGAELALMNPGLVNRLVMIDPFAYVPWYFSIFLKGTLGHMAYKTTFASPIGRYFTNQAVRSKRNKNSNLTGSFSRVNHDAVYAFLRMMSEHEGPSRYAKLDLPVDIITGKDTFNAVHKSVNMLQDTWPGARVHVIEGAGHLPIEEQSEQVTKLVFRND